MLICWTKTQAKNKNTCSLLVAISKEVGLEVNTEKTKRAFMSPEYNTEQNHST
jgi:hypothetical protein